MLFDKENARSTLLSEDENERIFDRLGRSRQTLATTVAQLFTTTPPEHSEWTYKHTGVLCLVKDFQTKSFYFRIFSLKGKLIWQHEIYRRLKYDLVAPFLHVFEGHIYVVAFNFPNEEEANTFHQVVINTVETMSSHIGTLHDVFTNIHKSSKPKKKRINKREIGQPSNFQHIAHESLSPKSPVQEDNNDLQTFLARAGVSEGLMKSKRFNKLLKEFFKEHGGVDSVLALESEYMSFQELQDAKKQLGNSKPIPDIDEDNFYEEVIGESIQKPPNSSASSKSPTNLPKPNQLLNLPPKKKSPYENIVINVAGKPMIAPPTSPEESQPPPPPRSASSSNHPNRYGRPLPPLPPKNASSSPPQIPIDIDQSNLPPRQTKKPQPRTPSPKSDVEEPLVNRKPLPVPRPEEADALPVLPAKPSITKPYESDSEPSDHYESIPNSPILPTRQQQLPPVNDQDQTKDLPPRLPPKLFKIRNDNSPTRSEVKNELSFKVPVFPQRGTVSKTREDDPPNIPTRSNKPRINVSQTETEESKVNPPPPPPPLHKQNTAPPIPLQPKQQLILPPTLPTKEYNPSSSDEEDFNDAEGYIDPRENLLADIRKGIMLKSIKTETTNRLGNVIPPRPMKENGSSPLPPKPPNTSQILNGDVSMPVANDPRGNLLADIRKGIALKNSKVRMVPSKVQPVQPAQLLDLASILKSKIEGRRTHLNSDSSYSDSDFSDDYDDEWQE